MGMAGDPTEPTHVLPQDSQYGEGESSSSLWVEAAKSPAEPEPIREEGAAESARERLNHSSLVPGSHCPCSTIRQEGAKGLS